MNRIPLRVRPGLGHRILFGVAVVFSDGGEGSGGGLAGRSSSPSPQGTTLEASKATPSSVLPKQ